MRINPLMVGALAAALALPVTAGAQQSQYPNGPAQSQPGAAQSQSAPAQDRARTPSPEKIQRHWMKRLAHLNLSGDQQQRIQSLINQFSQQHPAGSPRVPGAGRELRHQIMGVLTTDQQNQLLAEMRARRAQMRQYREQQYQQAPANQGQPPYQGQPPNQPPQQGVPPP